MHVSINSLIHICAVSVLLLLMSFSLDFGYFFFCFCLVRIHILLGKFLAFCGFLYVGSLTTYSCCCCFRVHVGLYGGVFVDFFFLRNSVI